MRGRLVSLLRLVCLGGLIALAVWGCGHRSTNQVVVYVSEDQVFSEPILRAFEQDTGIAVHAIYDTEEAKSTGVMNRLLAEKNNPQADVYWANEPIRAEVLKQRGISAPYVSPNAREIPATFQDPEGYWTGFSARARVLVVNKRVQDKPRSLLAYTDPRWKGQAVIANPLFGTTTVQIAALFTLWGDAQAQRFLQGMKENGVKFSTSNGESADFVAAGEVGFGLVDSDDGANRIQQGKPIEMIFPDQGPGEFGCLLVPNAVLLIKGARHPIGARKLIDYLLSRETERKLAFAACAQIPLHSGVETPAGVPRIETLKLMPIQYAQVAKKMEELQPLLKQWMGY